MSLPSPRSNLKVGFTLVILATYLLLGLLSLVLFSTMGQSALQHLGNSYAIKSAQWSRSRIRAPLERALALSLKLVDSPVIRHWMADEDNPGVRKQAMAELDSFRRSFRDHSVFVAIDASKHFYYRDRDTDPGSGYSYTMSSANPDDAWYFSTLDTVQGYALNIDHDRAAMATKVWINAVVRDGQQRLGIAGTGLELDRFIDEVIKTREAGVSSILFDANGAIQAHENPAYIDQDSLTKSAEQRHTVFKLMPPPSQGQLRSAMAALDTNTDGVQTLRLRVEGTNYTAALVYLPEIRWYSLTLLDLTQLQTLRRFLPMLAILAVSALVLIATIGLLLNRLVLTPLSGLTRSAQAMADGNYQERLPARRSDEIGRLTTAFNQMADKVHRHTEELEQAVTDRTAELSLTNRALAADLAYARRIQDSLLPETDVLERCFGEHFVLWKPRAVVGGDFYFLRERPDGYWLAVVDCTGHGVPGAFMSMTANSIFNQALGEYGQHGPAAVLQAAHRLTLDDIGERSSHRRLDTGMEAGLCCYHPQQRRLRFAGAGIGLLTTRAGNIVEIAGDRHGLGDPRTPDDYLFTETEISVVAEQRFYLGSDGILDLPGGAQGFGLGKRRLHEMLESLAAIPMSEQGGHLGRLLQGYQGEHPQRDDVTVIGFTPLPGNKAPSGMN